MRYLFLILFAGLLACNKDMPEPEATLIERKPQDQNCKADKWQALQVDVDTAYYNTFYVLTWKISKQGQDYGKWHNPKGDFARTFIANDGRILSQASYNKQINEDVVQKVRGQETRYPASIVYRDDLKRVLHKVNAYYHDADGEPARFIVNTQTGDTICKGNYECHRLVAGEYCEW